jgi:hypothetical protein
MEGLVVVGLGRVWRCEAAPTGFKPALAPSLPLLLLLESAFAKVALSFRRHAAFHNLTKGRNGLQQFKVHLGKDMPGSDIQAILAADSALSKL